MKPERDSPNISLSNAGVNLSVSRSEAMMNDFSS